MLIRSLSASRIFENQIMSYWVVPFISNPVISGALKVESKDKMNLLDGLLTG